ncbi:transposase zinc-binding domain-containing protein [Archangium violaceum]|uniref:transposase zinc-binding domain-containing protein n=1 Tax=Archangium violaceum TaxID=83451 RepID=UPI002B292BC8|nr:transposase zinc-binding domain-containing protein [Archangium gephyra]
MECGVLAHGFARVRCESCKDELLVAFSCKGRGVCPVVHPLRAYQAHSLQQRLRWTELDVRPPPRKQPRCALLEGFSLHANTHLHAPAPGGGVGTVAPCA